VGGSSHGHEPKKLVPSSTRDLCISSWKNAEKLSGSIRGGRGMTKRKTRVKNAERIIDQPIRPDAGCNPNEPSLEGGGMGAAARGLCSYANKKAERKKRGRKPSSNL